jgi:hypothetical protein
MIVAAALFVCLLALIWLFQSQRKRYRRKRADLAQLHASSRRWYESASAKTRGAKLQSERERPP